MKHLLYVLFLIAFSSTIIAQPKSGVGKKQDKPEVAPVKPAAYRTEVYLPLLEGKRVGIFANHTATIGKKHLVDSLFTLGVKISKVFGPEHGFRGDADAGEKVDTYTDPQLGIPVISLYGKKRKPSAEDLADVDVLLFDIQDVGTRFYTYISSLQEFMDAAFEHGKPLLILDRPNPNGFYVDGPILDTAYKSFVGMQPIPIVYGMTIGDKKTIHIPADQAYGQKEEHMIMEFPRDRFPADMVPEVGMQLNMSNGSGQNFPVVITEVREAVVVLDANHPLAGEDLIFDLELVSINGGSSLIITP